MSVADELYQRACDLAQEALDGADRKVEKLRGHLADAEAWLDSAKAKVAELEEQGLAGFLEEIGVLPDGDEEPAAEGPKGSGAVGAAAHNATAKVS